MARILLVDDEAANRALVVKLLRAAGHEVLQAIDALEGLALARQRPPDLILMDLSLPHMDGWQALGRLRSDPLTSKLAVVAATAHAMGGDRERAIAAGFDGFLSKPIDATKFADTIAAYLAGVARDAHDDRSLTILPERGQEAVT